MQEVIIARDAAAGRATDKSVNLLNTLLGSMNLKPSQQKEEADAELEKSLLALASKSGNLIDRFQKRRKKTEMFVRPLEI